MRIVICDDEQQYTDSVKAAIARWKELRKISSVYVTAYSSSEDLSEALGQNMPFDMAFLDIQFPGELNGLALAQLLRSRNEFMTLVLMTNYQEYAVEGYKVNALRFLPKPLDEAAIFECLDIAYRQWAVMNDKSLVIRGSSQSMRIPYRNIICAESMAHYVVIHQANPGNVTVRMKLSQLADELPKEMFMQCHRSYLVNFLHVCSISKSFIAMSDGEQIPVSPKLWKEAHRRFGDFYQGGTDGF